MRKIQNIAFVLLATLFAGCINDHIESTLCRDGVLSLNLSTGATTRTDTPNNGFGEGTNDNTPNTESAIKDIQFFLYPNGSKDNVNATFAGRIDVTATDTTEQTVTVPADAISNLCPTPGSECDIYVIVNYYEQMKEDLTTADDTSRATLKDKALSTEFYTNAGAFVYGPQSFVMDSEVFSVTRGTGDDSNKLISETIYVTRAAAKILIEVTVQSTVDVSGVKWEALTDIDTSHPYYMSLDFFNGVKDGVIDDNSDTDPAGKDIRPASTAEGYNPYYHIENVMMTAGSVGSDITNPDTSAVTRAETVKFIPMTPLYSYTSSWSDNDEDAPYFKLSIPWRKIVEGQDDNAAWVTYDYTVPISLKTNQLVRNKLYLIRLNVGALGDLDYLDPAVYSYVVLDWEDVSMNAELSRPSYLTVDTNYVEMKNVEEASVGYHSSDPVTVKIISSTIGGNNAVYEDYTVSAESGNIVLKHKLDNTRGDDDKTYDYLVQTFVVRVTNTATGMYEDITFVQSPAMYVITGSSVSGSVFVNRNQSSISSSSASNSWAYVGSGSQGSTKLYTIAVSAFDATTSNYLICDPREPANNNVFEFKSIDGNTDVATGTDASGDSDLTGYRATISGDASKNLVAPEFIIATGYGYYQVSWRNMYANSSAKYRCAGYQEAGYPAGRWRVPTPAELQVIGKLCAERKIDGIFVNSYTYMSSNGAYNYNTDNGTFTSAGGVDVAGNSIRCVYDTWYWKDKCANTSQFIWGADGDNLEQKRKDGYLVPIE